MNVLCKLHSGTSYSTVGYQLNVNESTKQLNNAFLNRNIHKTRLCVDQLIKCRDLSSQELNPVFPLDTVLQYLLTYFLRQLKEHTAMNNKN